MALLFIDGFDNCGNASNNLDKWDGVYAGNYWSGYGRWGGDMIALFGSGGYRDKLIPLRNEVILGAALYVGGHTYDTIFSSPLVWFWGPNGYSHIRIGLNTGGLLYVWDGQTQAIMGTASGGAILAGAYDAGAWKYVEIRVKVHATLGEVEIRVNEQTVLLLTGVDTYHSSDSAFIGKVSINQRYYNEYSFWDDLYIDDAQFHGNCRVRTFMPDSDGTHSDFTRSGGSNDYEMIDDTSPDDDSGYIASSTKGHKSTFGITTGTVGAGIKAVQVVHRLKVGTSGARRIHPLVRSGGADYRAPLTPPITDDYKYRRGIFVKDPQDNGDWNQTKLEAAEFGLELMDATTTTSTTTSTTTTV